MGGVGDMKKFLSSLLICTLILTAAPLTTFAAAAPVSQETDITYIDDLVIETVLTVYEVSAQTRDAQSISASKEVTAKNSAGNVVATFTLHGTFSYDGSSATCTSASYSKSIVNNTWSFTSARAWANANKANGSYTLTRSTNGQTVSDNVTITCSPTGKIS